MKSLLLAAATTVTLAAPDNCPSSGCTITATVTQGTHPFNDARYSQFPGKITFTLNGQTITAHAVFRNGVQLVEPYIKEPMGDQPSSAIYGVTSELVLKPGELFVMGDNRNDSNESRDRANSLQTGGRVFALQVKHVQIPTSHTLHNPHFAWLLSRTDTRERSVIFWKRQCEVANRDQSCGSLNSYAIVKESHALRQVQRIAVVYRPQQHPPFRRAGEPLRQLAHP